MSKASKHRFCPAVEREISSADCGQNRGARYACPPHCLHSPLASANYDLLLTVEDEVDRKTQERVAVEMHKAPELSKMLQRVSGSPSPHWLHALIEGILFFQRDANGLSLAERWQREGFPDLKNDERVLFQAKMQTRVALLEIRRIIDDQQVEAVDLLEPSPKPFILRDRSLAAIATRFAAGLTWVYPLPHYWRLSGTVILLPEFALLGPEEIVRETAQHLGAPATEKELRVWLAENFVRMDESLKEKKRRGDFLVEFKADHMAREDRAFLDEAVPALEGRTPRQAAQEPALRSKLIRLIKQRVRHHDERNLRTGRMDDINWMLRELGLNEILFDAPPKRLPVTNGNEFEDELPGEPIDESHLPPASLPPGALPHSVVITRMNAVLKQFRAVDEAISYLYDCDSAFINDATKLCEPEMDPFDLEYLLPWIVQARFTLVPFGFREPVLDYERLVINLEQKIALVNREAKTLSPELIEEWFADSRQPDLARLTALNLLESSSALPKEERPTAARELLMMLILILLIDELDQSIREEPLSV